MTNFIHHPLVMKCTDPSHAIFAHRGYGPTFGGSQIKSFSANNTAKINEVLQ